MARLSSAIFEWDPTDLRLLEQAKPSERRGLCELCTIGILMLVASSRPQHAFYVL